MIKCTDSDSAHRHPPTPSRSWPARLMPHLIFCVALIFTAVIWAQTNDHFEQVAEVRFSSRQALVKNKIEGRMIQYEQLLRSGVALFDSSNEVSRDEWKQFISCSEIQRWFPGVQSIGVAVPVAKGERTEFEKSIRQEGFPEFRISPPGDRHDYTAIKFIEPFSQQNRCAFGYDMYSSTVRREAMDRAAFTGDPSISERITLVQDFDGDVQSGILCYLPLYAKQVPLETIAQRKKALIGWVYAAFRCNDLMSEILGEHAKELRLEIYDSKESNANILFSSHPTSREPKSASAKDLAADCFN